MSIAVEFEFTPICQKCGSALEGKYGWNSKARETVLEIEPCEECLEEAKDKGKEEGHEEGYAEAKDEMNDENTQSGIKNENPKT